MNRIHFLFIWSIILLTSSSCGRASQWERDLISSLNAVRSGIQTGLSVERYLDLISSARQKLADLKLNSPSSSLIDPAKNYLDAHLKSAQLWNLTNANKFKQIGVNQNKNTEYIEFCLKIGLKTKAGTDIVGVSLNDSFVIAQPNVSTFGSNLAAGYGEEGHGLYLTSTVITKCDSIFWPPLELVIQKIIR